MLPREGGVVGLQAGHGAVALHVAGHLEEFAHEVGAALELGVAVSRVAENLAPEALGVEVGLLVVEGDLLPAGLLLVLDALAPVLVEVILEGLAHVVVDADGGIVGQELLALGLHGEDAADDDGGAGVHLAVFRAEDLGEALREAAADAVVLALTHIGEFAQAFVGRGQPLGERGPELLAARRQSALLMGALEDVRHVGVLCLADEPARAVAAVV